VSDWHRIAYGGNDNPEQWPEEVQADDVCLLQLDLAPGAVAVAGEAATP
jgi:hypothetical protein